jgi:hypothetical protein
VLPNSHGVTVQGSTQNVSMFHVSTYVKKRTAFKTNEGLSPRNMHSGYGAG